MAKKQNWIDRLKKLFSSETQSKQEKVNAKLKVNLFICVIKNKIEFRKQVGLMLQKERRRRWLFGRLKSKGPPALPAPTLPRLRSLREAEQEQSKHAVAVAVATAAAAEAAVTAAQAAALVVRLTGKPSSYHQTRETASVKIQTAFRGYLARRALRALKGLVKLQALIRGQAVRRQTNITLKGLHSLMKIQSQARANRMKAAFSSQTYETKDVFPQIYMANKEIGHTCAEYSDRKWDGSILSKEEIIALLKKRQDAVSKRERAADYASTHQEKRHTRRPSTSVNQLDPTWSWLEHWAGSQISDKDVTEVSPIPCRERIAPHKKPHASESLSFLDSAHLGKAEEFQPNHFARRSFNRSCRAPPKEDDDFSACPYLPSYMASTASTKAKFRSMSTPKQRQGNLDCSDQFSLNKDRPASPLSTVKIGLNHQRSPRLRGHACPAKHSIESELSLLSWDKLGPFR